MQHRDSVLISRRTALRIGAGIAAAGATGAAALLLPSIVEAHGTLTTQSQIAGIPTYYDNNASPTSFSYNPDFYNMLQQWWGFYYQNTPATYVNPSLIRLLGVHVDGDPSSMHEYGRAADFYKVEMTYAPGGFQFVSFWADHGAWQNDPQANTYRLRYWGAVASLNYHFKYVLHYHYNAEHDNHVHVDNQASGTGLSNFTTDSTSQVKFVQACCNYIFGLGTVIDGDFGPHSLADSDRVIAMAGGSGHITSSQQNWQLFCWAAMRVGHGLAIGGSCNGCQ